MRKSLWLMLAVMVVAVSAPNAHADTFTYSFTDTLGVSWTTVAIPGITMATTVPASDLTASSNTGTFAGCVTSSVILDAGGFGNTKTNFTGCGFGNVVDGDSFTITEYNTTGTHVDSTGDTLVVTAAVTAPEPSSVALMLLGVGLVFVMRKPNSRGRQLAA